MSTITERVRLDLDGYTLGEILEAVQEAISLVGESAELEVDGGYEYEGMYVSYTRTETEDDLIEARRQEWEHYACEEARQERFRTGTATLNDRMIQSMRQAFAASLRAE